MVAPRRLPTQTDTGRITRTINELIGYSGGFLPLGGGALTGPLLLPNGSASNPAWAFSVDPNTGARWISADEFALVVGALDALTLAKIGGLVGVGIGISPSVPLHVSESVASGFLSILENTNNTSGAKGIEATIASTNAADQILSIESGGIVRYVFWADGHLTGKDGEAVQKHPQVASCNANTALTTAWADVPNASVPLAGIGDWVVSATFAWTEATLGDVGLTAQGRLAITGGTGSVVNSTSQTAATLGIANNTYFASQRWLVQVTSGTVTAKLQTQKNAGVSGVGSTINQADTTILGIYAGNPV